MMILLSTSDAISLGENTPNIPHQILTLCNLSFANINQPFKLS
jgi:hypothetical protein